MSGFGVSSILVLAIGINPLIAFYAIFYGAFGNFYSIAETLVKTTPLLLTSLAIIVSFRCGVWNIGAEGQLILGAIATTAIGLFLSNHSTFILIPLCIIFSFLAGAAWAIIPGILRAKLKLNEILTTIMMNFIAIYLLSYLVTGPWRDPKAAEAFTPIIAQGAWLLRIVPKTRLHAGIFLAMVSAIFIHILLFKSYFGYRLRVVGSNPEAARYGGISVERNILISMLLSGGLAGLAGMSEISGIYHRLMQGISAGYGFTAIPVALLGKLHPIGTILASILFAALIVGGDSMQRIAQVPIALVNMIQALIIIFILIGEYFTKLR